MDFSYLKRLHVPQKLSFSHSLIDLLLKSGKELQKDDNGEIFNESPILLEELNLMINQETSFQIAKLEYEKKEERFIDLTAFTIERLDQIYFQSGKIFDDVGHEGLREAINDSNLGSIIEEVQKNRIIIEKDVQCSYDRILILTSHWNQLSHDLLEQINNLEQRGVKLISNNLRMKILPKLKELKSALKSDLIEGSMSRVEIKLKLDETLDQVKNDVFGDLTEKQIELLYNLNPQMGVDEFRKLMNDESTRKDFIDLIETEKISFRIIKIVDKLS